MAVGEDALKLGFGKFVREFGVGNIISFDIAPGIFDVGFPHRFYNGYPFDLLGEEGGGSMGNFDVKLVGSEFL